MTNSVTCRDLKPGDRFRFGADPREHPTIDDRDWAIYVGVGGTLREEERVVDGLLGVGENPAAVDSRR